MLDVAAIELQTPFAFRFPTPEGGIEELAPTHCEGGVKRNVDTRLKQANSSHANIDINIQIFNGFTSFISNKWFVHVFVCFVWLFVAILCLYISCVSVFVCLSDGLCVFAWSGLIRFDLVLV